MKQDWQKLEYKIEDLTNEKDEIIAEIYGLENPEMSEKIDCSNCGQTVDEDNWNEETDTCQKCSREILGDF